jgi:putative transposase
VKALCQSFFLMLAQATDREMARQIQYLKAKNRILRYKLPPRINVTPQERQRLLKYGQPLGGAIRELITTVSPRTFASWLSGQTGTAKSSQRTRPGRPRASEDVRELVLRLARENAWGYTRILDELKKLGVCKISRLTVIKILKDNGLEPGPRRGEDSWDEFFQRHRDTLWVCEFFSKKVWTLTELVEVFVLFFVHVGSRRIHLAGLTANPDRTWMVQQAHNIALRFDQEPVKPKYLLRDRDSKFVKEFDAILATEGIAVKPIAVRAPNQNAVAEHFVQSVKQECLDHFVVFGEAHLRHILSEYLVYYHKHRPHQGLCILPLTSTESATAGVDRPVGEVICEKRLGGLMRHYRRVRQNFSMVVNKIHVGAAR